MLSQGSVIFNGPVLDDDLEPYITVIPDVVNIEYSWHSWNNEIFVRGDFKPLTRYQITVASGLPDPWGGVTQSPYSFEFTTSALRSGIHIGRNDIIYAASDSKLAAKVTNVARARANLGQIPLDYFMVIGILDQMEEKWKQYKILRKQTQRSRNTPMTPARKN